MTNTVLRWRVAVAWKSPSQTLQLVGGGTKLCPPLPALGFFRITGGSIVDPCYEKGGNLCNNYRGADKSLARPTSWCILFDGDNISFDASFVIYRVSHELRSLLRESVPNVKIHRYNPKHLYPKLNGYGDNGQRSLKLWQLLHTYWLPNTY